MHKRPPHCSSIHTSWSDASVVPDCLQPHCLHGNNQWSHFICQHCSCKPCFLLCYTNNICSENIPTGSCSFYSLVEYNSYAKLQRTVITVFSFTYLQNYYRDGRLLAVWLYDGNVPFLQGKHMALFLMALTVTVFFILPFTLLLLFAPCIQASKHFLFKWIKMKLLPIRDAYQAPDKDEFRFCTGLMLVVHSILLVGYGLNILGDPETVYKNRALSILETSFILNLIILSGWTAYNNVDSSDEQTVLVCTSTGVTLTTFICIILYHTYLYLKSTKLHQCFKRHTIRRGDRRKRQAVESSLESAVDAPPLHPPTMELRELLLTEN